MEPSVNTFVCGATVLRSRYVILVVSTCIKNILKTIKLYPLCLNLTFKVLYHFLVPTWPIQRCHNEQLKNLVENTLGYKETDMCAFIPYDDMPVDDLHLRIRISQKLFNQVKTKKLCFCNPNIWFIVVVLFYSCCLADIFNIIYCTTYKYDLYNDTLKKE